MFVMLFLPAAIRILLCKSFYHRAITRVTTTDQHHFARCRHRQTREFNSGVKNICLILQCSMLVYTRLRVMLLLRKPTCSLRRNSQIGEVRCETVHVLVLKPVYDFLFDVTFVLCRQSVRRELAAYNGAGECGVFDPCASAYDELWNPVCSRSSLRRLQFAEAYGYDANLRQEPPPPAQFRPRVVKSISIAMLIRGAVCRLTCPAAPLHTRKNCLVVPMTLGRHSISMDLRA